MITLSLVLVLLLVLYGLDHDWPGLRWLERWVARYGPVIKDWVGRAPLTYVYLGLLTYTTWLLNNANGRLRMAFLEEQSTSLHQLAQAPLTVLLRSTLYVSPAELVVWWLGFTLVMAPLEHRFGWKRVLAIFTVGHVGATLLVAGYELIRLHTGTAALDVAFGVDVGASYGFAAIAAAATYLGPLRRRLLWSAAVLTVCVLGLFLDYGSTAVGHFVAACLGFACYPIVRPAVRARGAARLGTRRTEWLNLGTGRPPVRWP